jgi:hypothetical protein
VALDPRLEEIFCAWYDYEYAMDEESKALAKNQRNRVIMAALENAGSDADIRGFLCAFNTDYINWKILSRLKTGKKRF